MNAVANPAAEMTSLGRKSFLALVGHRVKALPQLVQDVSRSPVIYETYLNYAAAFGQGDINEILIRAAMSMAKKSYYRAFDKHRQRPAAVLRQAA